METGTCGAFATLLKKKQNLSADHGGHKKQKAGVDRKQDQCHLACWDNRR